MTTKQYLEQIGNIETLINKKLQQMELQWDIATSTTPQVSDGSARGLEASDKVGNTAIQRVVLTCEINELIDKKNMLVNEIITKLNKMSNITYRMILEERYINCSSWQKVAETINMPNECEYVRCRLHSLALKQFEKDTIGD